MNNKCTGFRFCLMMIAGTALLNPVLAQETNDEDNLMIYGGVSWHSFDNDWQQEDDNGWLWGLETPLYENLTFTYEKWRYNSDIENASGSTKFIQRRMGINYYTGAQSTSGWQRYLALGIGEQERKNSLMGRHDETTFDIGVGLKLNVSNNLWWRSDFKAVRVTGLSRWDAAVNLSLGFSF